MRSSMAMRASGVPFGGRDLGDLDLLERGLDRRSAVERPLAVKGLEAAGNESRRRERRGKPQGASKRRARRSGDDIDDPLRNDDDLLRGLPVQRPFYRIEGENGSLDFLFSGLAWHGDISPLLAVDLHRQSDRVIDQETGLDFRPGRLRDQGLSDRARPSTPRPDAASSAQ